MSNFEALIKATLDTTKAKSSFDSFKANIEKDIVKLKLDIDQNYLKNQISDLRVPGSLKTDVDKSYIQNQINSAISGIKFQLNPNSYQNSARQTGQNIGNIISDSATKSIERVTSAGTNKYFKVSTSGSNQFSKEMEKLVSEWTNGKGKLTDIKINTRTSFDTDEEKNIERLDNAIVKYTNDLGESIQKRIAWRQIGVTQNSKGEDVPLRGFVEVSAQYSKSIDEANSKTDNFINKQKQAVANLKNTLNQISSSALDSNATKPIMENFRRTAIIDQVNEVNRAISVLENSNVTTFTDSKIRVEEQISALKILIKEMQNAESTATALRSKPIDVIKDETSQKIKGLEADIKKAGVSSHELENYITDMNAALANPNIDTSGINNVLNIYAKAKAEFSTLKKEVSADSSIEKAKIRADSLISKINETVSHNSGLSGWETEINGVKTSVASLINDLQQVQTSGDVSLVSEKWRAFSDSAKKAKIIANEAIVDIEKINNEISTKSYDAKYSTMAAKLSPYSNQNTELLNQAREQAKIYADTLEDLRRHFDVNDPFKMNDQAVVNSFKNMTNAANTFDNVMTQIKNTGSKDLGEGVAERSANNVKAYYEANTRALKKYGAELKNLENQYKNVKTVEQELVLDNQFKNLQSKISAEGLTGKSQFEEVGRAFKKIGQFAMTYGLIRNLAFQVPREMIKAVQDVDTAMTNLYKVTDETAKRYDEFLSKAGDTAKSLGRNMSSYITQTSEWAKLGYTLAESEELSKVSSIYANVGEVDDKTAVSDMVTAMKAFNIEASDAVRIIDSLNALGRRNCPLI